MIHFSVCWIFCFYTPIYCISLYYCLHFQKVKNYLLVYVFNLQPSSDFFTFSAAFRCFSLSLLITLWAKASLSSKSSLLSRSILSKPSSKSSSGFSLVLDFLDFLDFFGLKNRTNYISEQIMAILVSSSEIQNFA